ncbi:site-specific DNA-methyltransferase [Burkholderia sp. Cy-637]|uniref:site-specific DNA-methyltransferase n=1 Tax=Burkholderia sp. Cy-637 TaxID=2608327 RepID=UPI0014214240|nr:site-specific DNA-methyltransferase [Burkholderia sp. Cy-637]NIF90026.1 site-specific DNA-methyltransferase [Burkholderia sp. Cy-637]
MTNKHNPKFQELVGKLREIFQIDRPELDFGIYRILNARAGEINGYLENRLAETVQAALSAGSVESSKQLQADLEKAIQQAQDVGINPDDAPKVKDLRAKLKDAAAGGSEHENAVFSHLLAFFSRYYKDGDFISQRRYKGDTYAIPYAGEEVMLHWANKDQYYTKSGENFANYSFKLEDGRTVHFRLAAADTAKDNRKDNDKERRFALVAAKTVTRGDENGDEVEEELVPVEEALGSDGNKELIIRFEYAAQPKGTKQEALVTKAVEAVLADAAVKARWLALGNRAPTEKSPQRTLLEKHLSDYTTKNTADYFIHKDLGGFLRRELDFYIKNEVMHLDDVQNAGAFADIEKNLRMIQCLRSIAQELIAFLAQMEDFQRKLWLKKKFVVSSHYCITLDRVPEALWPEVVANEQQWARWKQLGLWDGDAPGTVDDLKAALYRMVDTSLFPKEFKFSLLLELADLDSVTNGVLLNADNFQAMRLVEERYRDQIDCVYIDPPYNTGDDGFIYKDRYMSSSWLSMLESRVLQGRTLSKESSYFIASIDDCEVSAMFFALDSIFGKKNRLASLVWDRNRKNDAKYFSVGHEYMLVYAANKELLQHKETRLRELKSGVLEAEKAFARIIRKTGSDLVAAKAAWDAYVASIKDPETKAVLSKFQKFSARGPYRDDGNINWPGGGGPRYEVLHPETGEPVKLPKSGWRYADPKTFWEKYESGYIAFGADEAKVPGVVYYLFESMHQVMGSVFWSYAQTTNSDFEGLMGARLFDNPKEPKDIARLISYVGHDSAVVLDYFAGSGTTGQAVIDLNRFDQGRRKYILIEQGAYFDSVLNPRLNKVVFSSIWKDGRPSAVETGVSHCFRVLKLESYEDALNNLQLSRTAAQGDLLNTLPQQAKDDYLLNYLLDVESRGSLLSVEDFKKPFDYTLNVAVDSAGAFAPRKIDLVETFNFLIGLRVKHIDAQPERGFVTVTGTLPSHGASPGETCLVLWRDCDVLDYEGVSKLCDKLAINPADNEFDVVYINGDHNIPTVLTQTAEEGGATRVLKLRQIEPEFLERMFSVEDI